MYMSDNDEDQEDWSDLCQHCNDWPCRCLRDEQDELEYA